MLPFKTAFGFENKIRMTPDGIDIYVVNSSGGDWSIGEWVVWSADMEAEEVGAAGDPAPFAVMGACVEAITNGSSGWVRVFGRLEGASVVAGVTALQILTLGYNDGTEAQVHVDGADDYKCGMAMTAESGGTATVWIGH